MPLTANSNGEISGKFTIPANISAGSKLVQFTGAGGSNATAAFVGQGVRQVRTLQEVISITQQIQSPIRVDPLAQTFSLDAQQHIGGVDLVVVAKGATPIAVQIRETQVGFPTKTVLAEAQLIPSAITVGAWNRWTFAQPVVLLPQIEYAIVVLCNDATGAIATAELGKFDSTNQRWVTNQPYQVGVLLSSSNASTWTAHQDKDMTFRLLAAQYTESERIINLGACTVSGATDLIVLAPTIQPASGADSEIVLTLPSGDTVNASDRQVVRLPSATSGNVGVSIKLRATSKLSATLLPGTQLVAGTVDLAAQYISRAIDANATGCDVTIIFDAIIPPGAGVQPQVSGIDGGDPWVTAIQVGTAKPLGDGVFEYQYRLTGVNEAKVRVRLNLTGTVSARPMVSNLRVSVV